MHIPSIASRPEHGPDVDLHPEAGGGMSNPMLLHLALHPVQHLVLLSCPWSHGCQRPESFMKLAVCWALEALGSRVQEGTVVYLPVLSILVRTLIVQFTQGFRLSKICVIP